MYRRIIFTWLMALLLIIGAACSNEVTSDTKVEEDTTEEVATEQETTADDDELRTEYPITVTDASGVEVTFEQAPEKIVSTSPSETEILFALGLDDQIVGVSDFDDYPEQALDKPKVGGVVNPNEEAIIELEADLVIGGISMPDDVVNSLRGLGINLYKTDANSVQDALNNIIQMGVITDKQKEAEELVASMEATIEEVVEAVSVIEEDEKQKVYIEYSPGWTVGTGEFMHELIELAGGINIAADVEGWVEI